MFTFKSLLKALVAVTAIAAAGACLSAPAVPNRPETTVQLMPASDYKTFKVPANVKLYRVSFSNQFGMEIVGYMFVPDDLKGKAKAIVVGHPMGASKEQGAANYAAALASKGFVTLAVDQQFWGESGGYPRHAILPDLYAETFNAAVDFLGTRDFVNPDEIGILGVCGSGSFVISAAKIDPRMKAVATVSMYNIGEMRRSGINHSMGLDQRKKIIEQGAQQRYNDFLGKDQAFTGGSPAKLTPDMSPTQQHSYQYYSERGKFDVPGEPPEIYTRSDMPSNIKFMNFYPFVDIETISPRPMLFIIGENAHSRYFSEDAYKKAAEPKELVVIPKAGHFDLYDKEEFMPVDKLDEFFNKKL